MTKFEAGDFIVAAGAQAELAARSANKERLYTVLLTQTERDLLVSACIRQLDVIESALHQSEHLALHDPTDRRATPAYHEALKTRVGTWSWLHSRLCIAPVAVLP